MVCMSLLENCSYKGVCKLCVESGQDPAPDSEKSFQIRGQVYMHSEIRLNTSHLSTGGTSVELYFLPIQMLCNTNARSKIR